MPELDIRLLGAFALYLDGEALVRLNSPRTQALLAFLILRRSTSQPRQQVAFLLWPDLSEARARSNLRYQLYLLRRALPESDKFIQNDEMVVQWRPDAPFRADVAVFENTLSEADAAEQRGDRGVLRAALERAISVYSGDLLPNCYDDWILGERERLRQAMTHTLERLTQLFEEEKDYQGALMAAQRLLRYDPLHETTYRSLMRIQAALGDRVGALSAYRKCASILETELGVEPSKPTRELYDRLMIGWANTAAASAPVAAASSSASPQKALPNNLPVALSSFVGRRRELTEIKKLIGTARLVTLTGPGGCGKTRLSLQVATEMLDGRAQDAVWQVSLESVRDANHLPRAIASACGIRVRKKPNVKLLIEQFRHKRVLLLLDNCEHLLPSCSILVDRLLAECPRLLILATSREPLGLTGEYNWRVPPLSLPDTENVARAWPQLNAVLTTSEAVSLFVERATSTLPTFRLTEKNARAVVQICRRLDGIPLALELAAAWIQTLSPAQIAARLDDSLRLLSRGFPASLPRHRTLWDAINWSHDLLSEPERTLFRRLAVFNGGFSLEAAEAIAGSASPRTTSRDNTSGSSQRLEQPDSDPTSVLGLTSRLVDKSLVTVRHEATEEGRPRYYMLDTIRQYANERLDESGERSMMCEAHAGYFTSLAESAYLQLTGPEQERWLRQLARENANLNSALDCLIETRQAEMAFTHASSLARYWWTQGEAAEGLERLMRVLSLPGAHPRSRLRAKALAAASLLAWRVEKLDLAKRLREECLGIERESGDMQAVAYSLNSLANIIWAQGDPTGGELMFEESLKIARELSDKQAVANVLNNLGELARSRRDNKRAEGDLRESLSLNRELENDEGIALTEHNLGQVLLSLHQPIQASVLISSALEIYARLGHRNGIAMCLSGAAEVLTEQAHRLRGDSRSSLSLQAAKIFGAAKERHRLISAKLDAADQLSHDHYLAMVLKHLDAKSFKDGMEAGRELPEDESVRVALTSLHDLCPDASNPLP